MKSITKYTKSDM